jgi:TatD DNase family protein
MNVPLYDGHNHWQDERLAFVAETFGEILRRENIRKLVVNGASEEDWPAVRELARRHAEVLPSYGLHPWHVPRRSRDWRTRLLHYVDQQPCGIGEIGLDRWIEGYDSSQQEEVFLWQWHLAAALNLPASVHCLRAWGRLLELIQAEPRPSRGFLLHSYGGSREMIRPFADLGAYFSISGYFAHERKARQRETFRHIPPDRLLIETDAPDMMLPEDRIRFPLHDPNSGKPLNHPGNLGAVYAFAAELTGEKLEDLARRIEANFQRLFGNLGLQ